MDIPATRYSPTMRIPFITPCKRPCRAAGVATTCRSLIHGPRTLTRPRQATRRLIPLITANQRLTRRADSLTLTAHIVWLPVTSTTFQLLLIPLVFDAQRSEAGALAE